MNISGAKVFHSKHFFSSKQVFCHWVTYQVEAIRLMIFLYWVLKLENSVRSLWLWSESWVIPQSSVFFKDVVLLFQSRAGYEGAHFAFLTKHSVVISFFVQFLPEFSYYNVCKGHIRSECVYEIVHFPKYHRKNLIDFCPREGFID